MCLKRSLIGQEHSIGPTCAILHRNRAARASRELTRSASVGHAIVYPARALASFASPYATRSIGDLCGPGRKLYLPHNRKPARVRARSVRNSGTCADRLPLYGTTTMVIH